MNIFNPTSQAAALRAQVEFLRMMINHEIRMTTEVWFTLSKQYATASARVAGGNRNVSGAVNAQAGRMVKVFQRNYKRVGASFGEQVLDEKAGALKNMFPTESKTILQDYWAAFDKWTKETTAEHVVAVNKTTKKKLKRIIQRGVEAGKTNALIAKDIRESSKKFNRNRAALIASTEVHSAAVASTDIAVEQTGVDFRRDWGHSHDNRVRATHKVKQSRPQGKPFNIGGEPLMYPGDPKGSAKNIIKCRCVVLYRSLRKKYINLMEAKDGRQNNALRCSV